MTPPSKKELILLLRFAREYILASLLQWEKNLHDEQSSPVYRFHMECAEDLLAKIDEAVKNQEEFEKNNPKG